MAQAIVTAYQGVVSEIHTAREHAFAALIRALRTGAYLGEVHRRFGKSSWGTWLKDHCPQLPMSTAYRYRDLARKFPRVRKPEEIRNLKQAYIAVGIFPDPAEKATRRKAPDLSTVPPASGTDLASRVHSAWVFLGPELASIDLSTLETTERQHLRQELGRVARWLGSGLRPPRPNTDREPRQPPGALGRAGGKSMSVSSLIQWTDDTVNPVMGCSALCELRPSPARAWECTLKFFSREFPALDGAELAGRMDSVLAGRNATEIYQLCDRTLEALLQGTGVGSIAEAKRLREGYKAALDEIYICYAHQQTMMRGSDVTNPDKRTHKGFPVQFEMLKKFPGRMGEAAMRPDLYGKVRPDKPWLDYLPRVFFVSDMADALSEEIDFDYLKAEIIDVVSSPRGRQHIWLWLTKMPWRMAEFAVWLKATHQLGWPGHLVAMTSVTSAKTVIRAKKLLEVPARFRGLSVEPLWSDVQLPLAGIDWCIVGGQSGPGAKPFDVEWLRNARAQCNESGTAFFVKQLGAVPTDRERRINLRDEHGGDWNEWPAGLRIREMPAGFRSLRRK